MQQNPFLQQLVQHVDGVIFATLRIVGILLVYWVLRRLVRRAVEGIVTPLARRMEGSAPGRAVTLRGLLNSVSQYVLVFITGVMVLHAAGLNVTAILTGAGVAGLAVGFGAQKLVRDVISGFFILLEDQFAVGETITAAGATGVVEEMGMRATRLRDDAGKRVLIANGDITTVVNHSRGGIVVTVDVNAAPDTDLALVRTLVADLSPRPGYPAAPPVRAAGGPRSGEGAAADRFPGGDAGELSELLDEAPVLRGVAAFDAAKVTLRITARARPGRQQDAELALRQTLRERLLASGIRLV